MNLNRVEGHHPMMTHSMMLNEDKIMKGGANICLAQEITSSYHNSEQS